MPVRDDYKIVQGYKVKRKKTELEKRLTESEARTLLESINQETHKSFWKRNKAIVQLLLNTALRVGELSQLKLYDVVTVGGMVKDVLDVREEIAKRKKCRNIPLNRNAKEAIKVLVEGRPEAAIDDALIVKPNGQPLSYRAIQHVVTTSALKAGLDRLVGCHTLRHTCLSKLYEKTTNVKIVQTIAGHAQSKITIDLYTHATMDGLSKAVQTLDDEENDAD